ncbi:hypothetical protein NQ317_011283 [Molorchus minor]|uniref:RNase H type-1 domain-containing protein n=1 Tax=Molorchus minor TaxID=1323400 RepID=A0ABQ9IWF1_9CUCU|nr:hypothetical protein NQ317_011283 [Molorchus minor]
MEKATQNCPVHLMSQDRINPTTSPSLQMAPKLVIWQDRGYMGKPQNYPLPWGHMTPSSRPEGVRYSGVRVGKPEKGSERKNLQICSDSQATLLAIESSNMKSRYLESKKTLNDLASRNTVMITWVPGHSGVRKDEEVDRLPREGSARYLIEPKPILGVPCSRS